MRTDPRELHRRSFDFVVIGAGIQGAAIARDAALRGLSTLLLEARDVAAGTSSRSSRLVHGGLRYLRQGNLALVREALRERERLLRLAPHLVRPLPMLMPLFRGGAVPSWQLRIGTWLYARLAGRSTLPRPRRLSAKAALAAFPGLRADGLTGALEFFDARTQDGRLTLANVQDAVAAGARFVNHARVAAIDGDGLAVVDEITGDELRVAAGVLVNAAGPGVDAVRRLAGIDAPNLVRTTRGSHVVLPPRASELALCAFLSDARIQFVIPHDGGTLCGTTDVDDPFAEVEGGVPVADLDYLHHALGELLDPVPERSDMRFAYAGWRALPRQSGPPGALHREAFLVEERCALGNLHTVVGGKLTTHRSFAERTVARLARQVAPSPTRTRHLPGGAGPREVDDPLWWRHGSGVGALRALSGEDPAMREPLCPHRPFVVAELVHACRAQGAVTFADAMLRRLVHVAGPCVEEPCLRRAHEWFLRAARGSVDGDRDAAIARLRAEVSALIGELPTWRGGCT